MFAQGWPEDKFVHACNVLAQMLDNDQDGCADDIKVVKTLRKFRKGMAMFETRGTFEKYVDEIESSFRWQDLYASETEPTCSGKDETANCRDAAIEEIFHIVSGVGLSATYPEMFGECNAEGDKRSIMQVQMDIARGGHFDSVPTSYPSEAIYHYTDKTCSYACMGTEFIYWAVTSVLGGQNERAEMNMIEWEASTATQLNNKLPGMHSLVTDGKTTSMKLLSSQGELPGSGGSKYGARETYTPSKQTCPLGCELDGTGCGPMPDDNNFLDLCRFTDPDGKCEDNPEFKKRIRGKRRKCKWFGKRPRNPSKRCRWKNVIENCKVSCDACGKSGEEICEREGMKKLKKNPCNAITCCGWDPDTNQCWSNVDNDKCWQ